jgi:hypothetical protein
MQCQVWNRFIFQIILNGMNLAVILHSMKNGYQMMIMIKPSAPGLQQPKKQEEK